MEHDDKDGLAHLTQLTAKLAGQIGAIEIVAKAALTDPRIRAVVSVALEKLENTGDRGSPEALVHDVSMSTLREWLVKSKEFFNVTQDAVSAARQPSEPD